MTGTSNRPPVEIIARVGRIANNLRLLADQLSGVSDLIPTRPDPTQVEELVRMLDQLRCQASRLRAHSLYSPLWKDEWIEFQGDLDRAAALADGLLR
jgi:hypothetical protein